MPPRFAPCLPRSRHHMQQQWIGPPPPRGPLRSKRSTKSPQRSAVRGAISTSHRLRNELSAEVQASASVLGLVVRPVRLSLSGAEEVRYGVAAGGEEFRDQAPVAAPPERL